MIELIKKAMFAGIGLALKTKEEVESIARELANQAELSENEGKKFVNDFLKRYDESRDKLEEKVESSVRDVISRSRLATREELTEIKDEIKKIKKTTGADQT